MFESQEKCRARWCRNRARLAGEFCQSCDPNWERSAPTQQGPVKLPFELTCMICSHSSDRVQMMTQEWRNLLVKSGWLKCPKCGSRGVELLEVDRRGANVAGRPAQVRPIVAYRHIPRW